MAEEALKPCVTCERVPLTLYNFSDGLIVRVRFGCLCSSVIVYSDREPSARVPLRTALQVMKPA